jgi:hypothetical protein
LALALALAGCGSSTSSNTFVCHFGANAECNAQSGGVCESIGYCAYPSATCTGSGYRFSSNAGPYANMCVSGASDGGVDRPTTFREGGVEMVSPPEAGPTPDHMATTSDHPQTGCAQDSDCVTQFGSGYICSSTTNSCVQGNCDGKNTAACPATPAGGGTLTCVNYYCACPTQQTGTDIYVDVNNGSGIENGSLYCPWQELTQGVQARTALSATTMYTIHLAAGTYDDVGNFEQWPLRVPAYTTIQGGPNGWSDTHLTWQASGSRLSQYCAPSSITGAASCVLDIEDDNITIQDVVITNGLAGVGGNNLGISYSAPAPTTNTYLTAVVVTGCQGDGVAFQGSATTILQGSDLNANAYSGASVWGSARPQFNADCIGGTCYGSQFKSNGSDGVYVTGIGASFASNGSIFDSNTLNGIEINTGAKANLTNDDVSQNTQSGIWAHGGASNFSATGVNFNSNHGTAGIVLNDTAWMDLSGCQIESNTNDGFFDQRVCAGGCMKSAVSGSSFLKNGWDGVHVVTSGLLGAMNLDFGSAGGSAGGNYLNGVPASSSGTGNGYGGVCIDGGATGVQAQNVYFANEYFRFCGPNPSSFVSSTGTCSGGTSACPGGPPYGTCDFYYVDQGTPVSLGGSCTIHN